MNGVEVQVYDQYEIPSKDHNGWDLTKEIIKFDEEGKLFVGNLEIKQTPSRKHTRPMSQDEQSFAERYVLPYGNFIITAASLGVTAAAPAMVVAIIL